MADISHPRPRTNQIWGAELLVSGKSPEKVEELTGIPAHVLRRWSRRNLRFKKVMADARVRDDHPMAQAMDVARLVTEAFDRDGQGWLSESEDDDE